MAIDPEDLLIFRKRLNSKNELPSPAGKDEELLSAPKPQAKPIPTAQQAPEMRVLQEQQATDTALPEEPPAKETGEAPKEAAHVKMTRSAKENRAGAKGLDCVNHPWRSAYSLCNYCKRPFCYADLVPYSNNFYCLEDIDYVSKSTISVKYARNVLTSLASLVMVANAAVVVYLTYPSIVSLLDSLNSHVSAAISSGAAFSSTLNAVLSTFSAYPFQSIYVAVALLSFVAGISVLVSRKGFYFGVLVAFFTLLAFSYEYLSGIQYTYVLLISGVAFVELAVLAYSRMSSITFNPEEDKARKYIEWPRPEAF